MRCQARHCSQRRCSTILGAFLVNTNFLLACLIFRIPMLRGILILPSQVDLFIRGYSSIFPRRRVLLFVVLRGLARVILYLAYLRTAWWSQMLADLTVPLRVWYSIMIPLPQMSRAHLVKLPTFHLIPTSKFVSFAHLQIFRISRWASQPFPSFLLTVNWTSIAADLRRPECHHRATTHQWNWSQHQENVGSHGGQPGRGSNATVFAFNQSHSTGFAPHAARKQYFIQLSVSCLGMKPFLFRCVSWEFLCLRTSMSRFSWNILQWAITDFLSIQSIQTRSWSLWYETCATTPS